MATAKAELSPIFLDLVSRLAETSGAAGAAASSWSKREWQTPPPRSWDGDHGKIKDMSAAFDRTDLNAEYESIVGDPAAPGVVGDLIADGVQIAYVGAMERAYRARHASPVRCLMHAAARRRGHGDPAGILKGSLVTHVQNVVAAGRNNPGAAPSPAPSP